MIALFGRADVEDSTLGIVITALSVAIIAVREGIEAWRGDACATSAP